MCRVVSRGPNHPRREAPSPLHRGLGRLFATAALAVLVVPRAAPAASICQDGPATRLTGTYRFKASDDATAALLARLSGGEPVGSQIDAAALSALGIDPLVFDFLAGVDGRGGKRASRTLSPKEAARVLAALQSHGDDWLDLFREQRCPRGFAARQVLAAALGTADFDAFDFEALDHCGIQVVADCEVGDLAAVDITGLYFEEDRVPQRWRELGQAVLQLEYHEVDEAAGTDAWYDDATVVAVAVDDAAATFLTVMHAFFYPIPERMKEVMAGVVIEGETIRFNADDSLHVGDARVHIERGYLVESDAEIDQAVLRVPLDGVADKVPVLAQATTPPRHGANLLLVGFPWRAEPGAPRSYSRVVVRRTWADGTLELIGTGHKGNSGAALIDVESGDLVAIVHGAGDHQVLVDGRKRMAVIGGLATLVPDARAGYPVLRGQAEAILEQREVPVERWPAVMEALRTAVSPELWGTPSGGEGSLSPVDAAALYAALANQGVPLDPAGTWAALTAEALEAQADPPR